MFLSVHKIYTFIQCIFLLKYEIQEKKKTPFSSNKKGTIIIKLQKDMKFFQNFQKKKGILLDI